MRSCTSAIVAKTALSLAVVGCLPLLIREAMRQSALADFRDQEDRRGSE